ncbi:MAG TPA: hypothetical protein VJW20_20405 [Candidatus Angelobacter sp.]|nr:hypothetical protein [Candidatus Angelobacter sp.]
MNPQQALKELGYDTHRPCRGYVLVETRPGKFEHYAFRYRAGDGHVITRIGRLISVYRQPLSGLLIFRLDGATTLMERDINRQVESGLLIFRLDGATA